MAIRDFLGESTNNLISAIYIERLHSHERAKGEPECGDGLEMVPAKAL